MRRYFWKSLVWFVIASAVIVSLGRLLAPHADLFRPFVERFLSGRLDQPVRIERIEASWPRLSPQISLEGLTVGETDQRLLDVDRARLEFKLYNLLRPRHNSFELSILGLQLVLAQDERGRWSWRVDRGGDLASGWQQALSAGDLTLRDSGIRVAPAGLPAIEWSVPEALLNRSGNVVGVRLRAVSRGVRRASLDAQLALRTSNEGLEAVRGYARLDELALPEFGGALSAPGLEDLAVGGEAWMEWRRGRQARAHALVELMSAAGSGLAGQLASRMTLDGTWERSDYRVEVNAARRGESGTSLVDGLAFGRRGARTAIVADRLELVYLEALLRPWLGERARWPTHVAGVAHDLRLGFDDSGSVHAAAGRLSGLELDLTGPELAIRGLDLALALDGDALVLAPSGTPVASMPMLYDEPVAFAGMNGRVLLKPGGLELQDFELEHAAFEATVNGRIGLRDGPFLDLLVQVPRLEPDEPRRWLPKRGLPPKTRRWLDDALLALGRANATTTLFGDPRTWKAHVAPGSVTSRIDFKGLRLAYARGWPVAERIAGELEFVGESMRGSADAGRVAGVALRAPAFRVADTRNAEIELSLATEGKTGADDLARLAAALPLDAADQALSKMTWTGGAGARARLWFPVKHRQDWRLLGSIVFEDSTMRLEEYGLEWAAIAGEVPFTRDRIGPANLDLAVAGQPTGLVLDSWFRPSFRMTLDGDFPVVGIVPGSWRDALPALFDRLDGMSNYRIEFDAAAGDAGGGRDGRGIDMTVTSTLEGLESGLPAPLGKPSPARLPMSLTVPLDDDELRPVRFSLGELAAGAWLRSGDYWQLGLGLGGAAIDLPAAENFHVEGVLPVLDVGAWGDLLGSSVSPAALASDGTGPGRTGWLDLEIGNLVLGGTSMGAVQGVLNREGDYWRLSTAGERIEGTVRFAASYVADQSVVADLERLHWPAVERDPAEAPGAPARLSPLSVPAVDIAVRDLRWGELDMGEFRLNSHLDETGLQIEQVSSRRDGFELSGSGAWLASDDQPFSRMRLRFSAGDLGRTLAEAGFDIALQQGRAVVELEGRWPGSPLDLSLQRFDGGIDLVVSDGVIPEASPGAGRILGLVSLNSIPRRLRLDFSDVFGEGLSFDRVGGHFDLAGGVASTEDLRIDAPAAEIRMRGRTDLEARTYDQMLTVRPGVSSALPIIGALAGGPVGAAAGAALQQIFSRPLQGISEVRYSVTGTWADPVIEPVGVSTAPVGDDG